MAMWSVLCSCARKTIYAFDSDDISRDERQSRATGIADGRARSRNGVDLVVDGGDGEEDAES